jgi:hypothetical protein
VKLIVEARRQEFFTNEMTYFFSRLRTMGMTPEELSTHYKHFLEE